MDRFLEQRLAAQAAPFAGDTLSPTTMLELPRLCRALGSIARTASPAERGQPLLFLRCRHEADGRTSEAREVSWAWLDQLCESPDLLFEARTGEALVSLGFYPARGTFYLRTYVMDEDEDDEYPGRWGDFDVSGPAERVGSLRDALADVTGALEISPSLDYFRQRSAR